MHNLSRHHSSNTCHTFRHAETGGPSLPTLKHLGFCLLAAFRLKKSLYYDPDAPLVVGRAQDAFILPATLGRHNATHMVNQAAAQLDKADPGRGPITGFPKQSVRWCGHAVVQRHWGCMQLDKPPVRARRGPGDVLGLAGSGSFQEPRPFLHQRPTHPISVVCRLPQ
jgi:hypothetical protein